MRNFIVLAALASFASARHFVNSNGTHFVDPQTSDIIQHFGCDVHRGHGSAHYRKTIADLHEQHIHSLSARSPRARVMKKLSITVPTYFHVITTAAHEGTITQDMVNAQIAEMNTAYNKYGINFNLLGSDFTTNDAWAIAQPADMAAAKTALRKGTYSTLNIYFHTDLAGGNLGTCTLPSQVPPNSNPSIYNSDGCNVNANTMPSGSFTGYNQGKTAVHETGHWLGLLHTFEGYSCSGSGDFVGDTPMESQSTDGCPTSPAKNTCPDNNGMDPVHNYMDYSTDACYTGFTAGQVARMGALWKQYRQGM